MDHKLIGLLLGPAFFIVYFLAKREYYAALGAFLTAIVGIPLFRWYMMLEPSPTYNFILGLLVGGITTTAFFVWQEKTRSHKK